MGLIHYPVEQISILNYKYTAYIFPLKWWQISILNYKYTAVDIFLEAYMPKSQLSIPCTLFPNSPMLSQQDYMVKSVIKALVVDVGYQYTAYMWSA